MSHTAHTIQPGTLPTPCSMPPFPHLRGSDCHGDVDVVPVDYLVVIDDGVDDGYLGEGVGRGLHEG